ncbi:hypothetical protein KOR42_28290 [Thalassoglobus neptunius]|uniref:Uncharacterized protein n=1 Tax=Thalassoglobus neptunius TaxID=1938619 RepID=A0A5C5WZX1_9PLAN|nr:hypothetical protein [Thalassoglobus neptunius]TWT55443.1 hypothetical protein KOR42_28290 [Thalassoglobus neptunius]
MKRIQLLIVAGCLLPAASVMGQAPMPQVSPQQIQQTGINLPEHKQQVHQFVYDAKMGQGPSQTVFYGQTVSGATGGCPTGHCPPGQYGQQMYPQYGSYGGYASCPVAGSACGGCQSCYPKHRYSSAYNVPRGYGPGGQLQYPQKNATGGAIVYPYYTHKGPSDFFRK